MSASNSNASDREFDAIHRAQRAHERSMEEILASIRNMIADDPARAGREPPEPAPAALRETAHARDGGRVGSEPHEAMERPEAAAPGIPWRRIEEVEGEPAGDGEEPLLSPEADEAAALSFAALQASLEVRGAELADEMVREMLRPMLKQWLDENLPSIVERLVRTEIQRVARGRA